MKYRKYCMLHDEKAVMGLPIYIVVAIVVAAAGMAVFSIAIYNIWMDSQIHQVECEIDKIVSEAENMFEYAVEGTIVTVHADFSPSMRFIVFGGLPKNSSYESTDIKLDENTSNNYYFVMNNGRIFTFHSNARFSGKNHSEIAVFHPGVYDLKLELIKGDNGRTYVKIY